MCESELEKKEPDVHSPDTGEVSALAPEEASLALSQITQVIEREEQNGTRQTTDPEHPLAKPLSNQAKADLREILRHFTRPTLRMCSRRSRPMTVWPFGNSSITKTKATCSSK